MYIGEKKTILYIAKNTILYIGKIAANTILYIGKNTRYKKGYLFIIIVAEMVEMTASYSFVRIVLLITNRKRRVKWAINSSDTLCC